MTSRLLSLVALAFVSVALVVARPAAADQSPDKVFAGKILTSTKNFPMRAKSGSAMVAAVKKQSVAQFMEKVTTTTDEKTKKTTTTKTWHIYFAAWFRRPLNDIEIVVKLYDNGKPGRPMVASFEQYLSERGMKSLLSDFVLDRKNVGVNRELNMVIEVGGAVVATGKFRILGEEERLTGKVDFSADETEDDEAEQ